MKEPSEQQLEAELYRLAQIAEAAEASGDHALARKCMLAFESGKRSRVLMVLRKHGGGNRGGAVLLRCDMKAKKTKRICTPCGIVDAEDKS